MRLLLPVLVVLALAVPAQAADGFTRQPALEQITTWLAGRDTEVYCAVDDAAYRAFEVSVGRPAGSTVALSRIGGPDIYLSPGVCGDLTSRPRSARTFAASVLTLAHEPQHSKGVRDESEADCTALRYVDDVAWRLGVRFMGRIYRTVQLAWDVHRTKPPEYTRLCP